MHQDSRSELPPAASPPPRARWRPDPARLGRLRWATGLWLFLFAATHLTNHALGLVSLRAMEAGRELFLSFWRLPPIEASLALALLVHVALGLHRLWQRRTLHLRAVEVLQLALGLSIPLYLTGHVLNNGWLHRCCGLIDSYAHLLGRIWPDGAWSQTTLTLLVWLHGAIGVQQRLRLEPFYHRLRPWLLVAATLLPVLAIGGMVSAGRELAVLRALDPVAWRELAEPQGWTLDAAFRERFVATPERWIVRGFLVLVAAVLLMRALRGLWERRRRVRLLYPGEREVSVPRGVTVLEASLLSGIPHAAVCGGRGRCSTCRVRVGAGGARLPAPSPEERRVLARIGAPPDVRLACQIRPTGGTLAVTPLMPASVTPRALLVTTLPGQGVERVIAVLFSDLRGFTRLSEGRLPYDTVFILNRYFAVMGEAIEEAGGRIDKFIGDGIMALFGVDEPPARAALAGLAAARAMALALDRLNQELAVELSEPLRMGIGLHLGPAILGEMGHGRARSLTAIGDTVNLASRLEALAKELGCQLVVSDAVAEHAAEALADLPCRETEVRGRAGRLGVRLIADATSLPSLVPPGTARAAGYRQRWRARLRLALDRAGPEGSKIAATAPSAPDGRPSAR